MLPVKTVHRKQLHQSEQFYFQELQLQKSVKVSDVNKLVFLQKSVRTFSQSIIAQEFLIYALQRIFRFIKSY